MAILGDFDIRPGHPCYEVVLPVEYVEDDTDIRELRDIDVAHGDAKSGIE